MLRHHSENSSVGIDLTARSVATNLNADINIQINAYGKSVSFKFGHCFRIRSTEVLNSDSLSMQP